MSYQVLARKYRPQRFDDVVGQEVVTRTLRNAIVSGRIAHAFVFAGSRGCGKTTTARILARALNCIKGPTPDPCGECDACVEIAQGRDLDVLEIDAASHTGVDNIREVVIAGLAFPPARDRYKVFIIDEVHQLSTASFNALLKSIEEPPPHVVFMMATTELHKIPDTILSRSQVFEFRTISPKAITDQLRRIAAAENVEAADAALALIARAAEGSMRDAQSALDQVIAFAGKAIGADDVSTVLGLVGRDLLMNVIDAVVAEDAPRAFALAERAVESGTDLRLVCRELTQVVRDMMVMSVDPSRVTDAELPADERERLTALSRQFSREDLMRAFDLLSTAEQDIRTVSHPRYYFEMLLLRWMHLRKLVPLADLLEQLGSGGTRNQPAPTGVKAAPASSKFAPTSNKVAPTSSRLAPTSNNVAPTSSKLAPTSDNVTPTSSKVAPTSSLKDSLLAEIRAGKAFFYNTVVAQAQKIDVVEDRVTFTFLPAHRALREQFEQARPWLEAAAERLTGRKIVVAAVQATDSTEAAEPEPKTSAAAAAPKRDLKAEALSSTGVQALLDVFPAEIRDVEEM
ncbi:MAG TPA: DNA polymerase III subunit gamma/tau [Vicinamibacterales bacterium]|nr:DNA polymerase III subunit gamma/tau [Vicinamibacterales bacterium]